MAMNYMFNKISLSKQEDETKLQNFNSKEIVNGS